jgi:hypothetical protein
MRARRLRPLLPLLGLVALVVFLALRLPVAVSGSLRRATDAWRDRTFDAETALAHMRGPEYVAAIRRIREELPADAEYLLLSSASGADIFVRFDLAPRRAVFGGSPKDIATNVTPAKLPTLPRWTIIPLLDPPGPRLLETRLLAERGVVR